MTLCGKRIDWKAQQNSNEGREGVEKPLWSDGNKCQNSGGRTVPERKGSWVGSSQAQMFWGSRHRLTLLLAHCISQDSLLGGKHWGAKIRLDSLAGPGTTCEFLSGHPFVVWEPKVLWLSRWITRCASLFIPHLCCSWLPTDCELKSVPVLGSADTSIHTNLLDNHNILRYQCVVRNICRVWRESH